MAQAFNIAFERWQVQKKKKAARQQQQQQQKMEQKPEQDMATKVANGGSPVAAKDLAQVVDLLGK